MVFEASTRTKAEKAAVRLEENGDKKEAENADDSEDGEDVHGRGE
jgi:hypothetical protein